MIIHIIIILLMSLLLINPSFVNGIYIVTGDYSNMDGMQVYYIYSSRVYLFGTYKGSSTSITATIYLFMSDTKSHINSSDGIWAGFGFGSSTMRNSDMVMCYYIPQNQFSCIDTWSDSYDIPTSDGLLGRKNDVSGVSGSIQTVSISSYNSLIIFTFTKDISNPDSYDWIDFPSWQTNQGGTSGAYGYLSVSKNALRHPQYSRRSSLSDGNGFAYSLSFDLGGSSGTSTTTSNMTTSTQATTTNYPSTTPSSTSSIATTSNTINSTSAPSNPTTTSSTPLIQINTPISTSITTVPSTIIFPTAASGVIITNSSSSSEDSKTVITTSLPTSTTSIPTTIPIITNSSSTSNDSIPNSTNIVSINYKPTVDSSITKNSSMNISETSPMHDELINFNTAHNSTNSIEIASPVTPGSSNNGASIDFLQFNFFLLLALHMILIY